MSYGISIPAPVFTPTAPPAKQPTSTRESFAADASAVFEQFEKTTRYGSKEVQARVEQHIQAAVVSVAKLLDTLAGDEFRVSISGHATDGQDSPDSMNISIYQVRS